MTHCIIIFQVSFIFYFLGLKNKTKNNNNLIISKNESFLLNNSNQKDFKEVNPNSLNDQEKIIWSVSPQIKAFTFVDYEGLVYDLSYLYDINQDYYVNKNNSLFYFNIGNFGITNCKKDNSYIVYINEKDVNNTDCSLLSGTNKEKPSKWRIRKSLNSSSLKPFEESVLEIELPPGDKCKSDRNSFYQTTFIISCDNDVVKLAIDDIADLSISKCKNTIKMRSQYACPNSQTYAISNAIKRNSKLFSFVLIFFGYFLTFLSYKYSDINQILIGVIFILYLSIYVILNHFSNEILYNQNQLFVWILLSILIGIGIGLLYTNSIVLCSATLGGFTAYLFTNILMQSFIVQITRYANICFWIIFFILFSSSVYLGVRFKKHFFIIFSCFIGAYSIVRGIGVLEGNFPDEQQIYALTNHGEIYQINKLIDYRYYIYIVVAFFLAIAGVCFQFRYYFKDMKSYN